MEAKIHIEGTIGYVDPAYKAYTVTDLVSDIKEARQAGATSFRFFIDSQGGLVDEGFAMKEIIEAMPEPTTTVAVNVYSIANIPFFAGKKRERDTLSTFMLHQALTTLTGNSDDLRQVAEILDRETDRIASYISMRSGLGMGEVKALMKIDRYIDEEEAERLGFFGESPAPLRAVAWAKGSFERVKSETTNSNIMSTVKEAFANLGRALGVYNSAEAMEHGKEEKPKAVEAQNNEDEEIDKDTLIAELQSKIQELEGRLQAMGEKKKAMEEEEMGMEKKYENLQNLVVNLEKKQTEMEAKLEEAKRLSSSATAPAKHERFNQKPEPHGIEEPYNPDLRGAAKLLAKKRGQL